jgi:hypothetical protein
MAKPQVVAAKTGRGKRSKESFSARILDATEVKP